MEDFTKIVNDRKKLAIFAKISIFDVRLGSKHALAKRYLFNQIPELK